MYISHLILENFRNFGELYLELPPGRTVLVGGNAQGKSNLLEALHIFATAKSMRATHERELVHWQAVHLEIPFARIKGSICKRVRTSQVEIVLQLTPPSAGDSIGQARTPQLQKRVKVNGVPRRVSDLVGEANVVLFAPQDLELVYGSPTLRRKYLDITLAQVDPHLFRELQRYAKVLSHRNGLLRAIGEGRASREELFFWDGELIEAGSLITLERMRALREMGALSRAVHSDLTGSQEGMDLVYLPSVPTRIGASLEEVRGAFQAAVESLREKEVLLGASLIGPHRDDFQFHANRMNLGLFGSRGQQRTAALSLKLAEARFMAQRTGERPVVLLDDVLSELDSSRRGYVLSSLGEEGQMILTTTDSERIDPGFLSRATLLEVIQGRVTRSVQAA